MERKTKAKYAELQRQYAGVILIVNYADRTKSLAFTPIESIDSQVLCACGHAIWNATNFCNPVHFCPNRELEVIVTNFRAVT